MANPFRSIATKAAEEVVEHEGPAVLRAARKLFGMAATKEGEALGAGYIDDAGKLLETMADDPHYEMAYAAFKKAGKKVAADDMSLAHQFIDETKSIRYRQDMDSLYIQLPKDKITTSQLESIKKIAQQNKIRPNKVIWEYYEPGQYNKPLRSGQGMGSLVKEYYGSGRLIPRAVAATAGAGALAAGEARAEDVNPFRAPTQTEDASNPFRAAPPEEKGSPASDLIKTIGEVSLEAQKRVLNPMAHIEKDLPAAIRGYDWMMIPSRTVANFVRGKTAGLMSKIDSVPLQRALTAKYIMDGWPADAVMAPETQVGIKGTADMIKNKAIPYVTGEIASTPLDPLTLGMAGASAAKKILSPAMTAALKLAEGDTKLARIAEEAADAAQSHSLKGLIEDELLKLPPPAPRVPRKPNIFEGVPVTPSAFDSVVDKRVMGPAYDQVERLPGAGSEIPMKKPPKYWFVAGEKVPAEVALQNGLSQSEEELRSQAQKIIVEKAVERSTKQSDIGKGLQKVVRDTAISPDAALKSMGPSGKKLADSYQVIRASAEVKAGNAIQDYVNITKGMNPEQKKLLVDMAEGRMEISNDARVNEAFNVYNKLRNQVKDEFQSVGGMKLSRKGDIVPFTGRTNYFPHKLPPIEELASGKIRNEVLEAAVARGEFKTIQDANKSLDAFLSYVKSNGREKAFLSRMVKDGKARDLAEAEFKLRTFIRPRATRRFASLEKMREMDLPFWDPNPDRVLPSYLQDAWRRVEEVRVFGPRNEGARALIDQIREEGGDVRYAYNTLHKFQGRELADKEAQALSGALRTYQTWTKLGLSQIVNMPQGVVNSAVKANVKTTMAGLHDVFYSAEQASEYASRIGAITDATLKQVLEEMGPKKAKSFLTMTGFSSTERFNRVLSANVAKHWIPELAEKLKLNPRNQFVRRELGKLGLEAEDILAHGLNEMQLQEASSRFVNLTQFRNAPSDLPLTWSSPYGKVMTQFKSFAFNHTKFIKDEVLGEAQKGNFAPALRYLAIGGLSGEVVADTMSVLKSRPRPENPAMRVLENLSYVGGIGLFSDLLRASVNGDGAVLHMLAGPTLGDAAEYIADIGRLTWGGDPTPLAKKATRSIPGIGPVIAPLLFPKKASSKVDLDLTTLDESTPLLGLSGGL